MGVKLAVKPVDGGVTPSQMAIGDLAEVLHDPAGIDVGRIAYRSGGMLHLLGGGRYWTTPENSGLRVRILQPGETIEITED